MRELVTLYEAFLTYGGMSVWEIALAFEETMDEDMISHAPQFIAYMVRIAETRDPSGYACRRFGLPSRAGRFVDIFPKSVSGGGACCRTYIASGVRGWVGDPLKAGNRTEGVVRRYGTGSPGPAASGLYPFAS